MRTSGRAAPSLPRTRGLRERDLRKFAALSDAAARAFRHRGVDALTATLAAELGVMAFRVAVTRWLDDGSDRALPELVVDTLGALRSVASHAPTPLV